MRAFSLEIDELAALVGFLNARKLVGLDESLFRAFSEENLPRLVAKLNEHGWLAPAERPGTYHFNEELMQTLAVAVAPQFAVLARSASRAKSIVFYLADAAITEIVVTGDKAVVVRIDGPGEMAAEIVEFLREALPAEIAVARVKGQTLDAGRRATADASGALVAKNPALLPAGASVFRAESVAAFVLAAAADLRDQPGG